MQTLIPQSASARAKPLGRTGRPFGLGLTPLAVLLFCAGILLAIPAFYHARLIGFMLGWDALLALLVLLDVARLPRPEEFTVTRGFIDSPQLGVGTRIELTLRQDTNSLVNVIAVDDLNASLVAVPEAQKIEVFPREDAVSMTTVYPRERGDGTLGKVFLRYRGALKLVERWAAALPGEMQSAKPRKEPLIVPAFIFVAGIVLGAIAAAYINRYMENWFLALLAIAACCGFGFFAMFKMLVPPVFDSAHAQRIRVFPAHEDSRNNTRFYLLRARQIELQKRKLRMRGVGRDFDSLREYQSGDELRNISWTATARRGRLVTRQFTVERSQQVWMLIDAGRLSRTAFELRRGDMEHIAETEAERDRAHLLTVTQLDQATTAATMLAQVIGGSGDKFAMMAYGRGVQQALMPGAGPVHLRILLDLLSQTKAEGAEADHLNAIARLKTMQRRRGLMVWITELVDSAGRPELVTAASELVQRHLVVLVLLKHPEMDALANSKPTTAEEMFRVAAAQEMLERRRETIAQLERQGVLIVETTAKEVGINAVSKYLEVKAKGIL